VKEEQCQRRQYPDLEHLEQQAQHRTTAERVALVDGSV
jgi:hypothetical protein